MQSSKQNLMELRQEAEAKLAHKPLIFTQSNPGDELLYELLHELSVYKIELEMQNEALRQSQLELEKSRDRYVNLYDFAPVGYITLNREAMIDGINLTAAALLGIERNMLMRRRFAGYIAKVDRERWHRYFMAVLNSDHKSSCEVLIESGTGNQFSAMLYCQSQTSESNEPVVRIVLADLAEREQAHAVTS